MKTLLFAVLCSCSLFAQQNDELVKNYIQKQLSNYSSVSVNSIVYPSSVISGTNSFSIDPSRPFTFNGGFGYVPVTLSDTKGGKIKTLFSVRVQVFAKVVVAHKAFKLGEDLVPGDCIIEDRDLTKVRGDILFNTMEVAESRAGMFIAPGTVITKNMLQLRPIIKHGASLTAYVGKGGLEVTMPVVARDDGKAGEVIRVMTNDKKIFKARVESPERVQILE